MVAENKQQFVAQRAAPLSLRQLPSSFGPARVLSAPVSATDFAELRADWLKHGSNQNLGPTDPTSARFTYVSCFEPAALLSEPGQLLECTGTQGSNHALAGETTVAIIRAGTVDGFALFCEGDISPSAASAKIAGPAQVFLPIASSFDVRPGDRLTLNVHQPATASSGGYIVRWSGGVDWDGQRTFHMVVA